MSSPNLLCLPMLCVFYTFEMSSGLGGFYEPVSSFLTISLINDARGSRIRPSVNGPSSAGRENSSDLHLDLPYPQKFIWSMSNPDRFDMLKGSRCLFTLFGLPVLISGSELWSAHPLTDRCRERVPLAALYVDSDGSGVTGNNTFDRTFGGALGALPSPLF